MENSRIGRVARKTGETDIIVEIHLDGSGSYKIDTPVPFLNHMLTLLSVHSLCDLNVSAMGDMDVDDHHTVEDIAICLGQALKEAVGSKNGIYRYGEATIPMDESLARVVMDFSGRPYLSYNVDMFPQRLGGLATENVKEFFQALANTSGITVHIDLLRGDNAHHIIEAIFKAFARALRQAVTVTEGVAGVWSSKGKLE